MSPISPIGSRQLGSGEGRVSVLRTDRLVLTTWSSYDLPDLVSLHGDPVAMRHMASGVQNADETLARLQNWQREHAAQGWSKWRVQTLDGLFVGRAGFGRAHETPCREVGYVLASQFWGSGFATELVRALTCWHHQNYDAGLDPDLLAYVLATNVASLRVLEKTGFRSLGADPSDPRQLIYRNQL